MIIFNLPGMLGVHFVALYKHCQPKCKCRSNVCRFRVQQTHEYIKYPRVRLHFADRLPSS